MHNKLSACGTIGIAIWLGFCSGCVYTGSVRDEPRQAVRFETAAGLEVTR